MGFKNYAAGAGLCVVSGLIGFMVGGFVVGPSSYEQGIPSGAYEKTVEGDDRKFLVIESNSGRKAIMVRDSAGAYSEWDSSESEKSGRQKDSDLSDKILE